MPVIERAIETTGWSSVRADRFRRCPNCDENLMIEPEVVGINGSNILYFNLIKTTPKQKYINNATYECPVCKHKVVAPKGLQVFCIEHIGKRSTGIQPMMYEIPDPTLEEIFGDDEQ